jgi:hypothetical protein
VPYQPETLCVADVEVDYKALIDALRTGADLREVSARNTTIVFAMDQDTLNVWQLSALAGTLLRLCDRTRTVRDIVGEFSALDVAVEDVPPETVCLFGLSQLSGDGFIRLSASPIVWEEDESAPGAVVASTGYLLPPQAGNTQQPWPTLAGE